MYTYQYPRPAVTVDMLILDKSGSSPKILLIERRNDPFAGYWAMPGGFVDENEDISDAALRELREETSLTDVALHQFGAFGKPGRDPRGHTITIAYWGIADNPQQASAADDAKNLKWYEINNLPPLAFDHLEIIQAGLKKIGL
jgi:8-oxo-dGTP diphosphatase